MILIADSGGTKTDWRLLNGETIEQFRTAGMNPYIVDSESMDAIVAELNESLGSHKVDQVFFYGAGCSSTKNIEKVSKSLDKHFPEASISVKHDLIAAARALCGREMGIACILGTGANSCLYNGSEIIENIPSLGYVLGDEGGGAHLGKLLLRSYFTKSLPNELCEALEARFEMDRNTILENVYQKSQPATYLASFSKFIFDHKEDAFIAELIHRSFSEFFKCNVLRYKEADSVKIHFCGSVAYFYNSVIRKIGSDLNLEIGNIVESPIAGLTLFHQEVKE